MRRSMTLLFAFAVLLAACAPAAAPAPQPTAAPTQPPAPTATAIPPTATATAVPPTATAEPTATTAPTEAPTATAVPPTATLEPSPTAVPPTATPQPPAAPSGDPAQGQALWAAQPCSGCHGPNAGGGIGPALAGTSLTLEQVLSQVRNGEAPMPAFSADQISDQQVAHIYAWLKSLAP